MFRVDFNASNPLGVGPTTALFIFAPFVVVAVLNKIKLFARRILGHEIHSSSIETLVDNMATFGVIMALSFVCEYEPNTRAMHKEKSKMSEYDFWVTALVLCCGFAMFSFQSAAVKAAEAVQVERNTRRQARVHISKDMREQMKQTLNQNVTNAQSQSTSWAVFDVPLALSARNTSVDGKGLVPALVSDSLEWLNANSLETEGLWRCPGNMAVLDDLEMDWSDGRVKYDDKTSPFDVCSLLKRYFRMLLLQGKPIWTASLDAEFKACRALSGQTLIDRVKGLVSRLPACNREVLRLMSVHLQLVTANADVNKMNLSNVLRCVFVEHSAALRCLIQNHEEVFASATTSLGNDEAEDTAPPGENPKDTAPPGENLKDTATESPPPPASDDHPVTQPPLLHRSQTEELRGVLQMLVLLYHFFAIKSVYRWIRVFIAGYSFLTGFGHLSFFIHKQRFGVVRMFRMLWRVNISAAALSFATGNSFILYYISAQTTLYFFIVYLSSLLSWKVGGLCGLSVGSKGAGAVAIAAVMMTIIYDCPWVSTSGVSSFELLLGFAFRKSPAQCNDAWEDRTLTQPCPVGGRGAQWEWYFRTSLDHWAVVIGMMVAYIIATLNLRAQKAFSCVSTTITVIIGAGLLVVWSLYYPTAESVAGLSKAEYNLLHPYISWTPLLGYLMLRNATPSLQTHFSTLFAQIGTLTLETYLLQHHIWMVRNAKSVLVLIPGYPDLNIFATTVLFFMASHYLQTSTSSVGNILMPANSTVTTLGNLCLVLMWGCMCHWMALELVSASVAHVMVIVSNLAAALFGMIFFGFFSAGWTHINVLLAAIVALPVCAMCWNLRKEHEWRFDVGSTGSGDTLGCLTGSNCTAHQRMDSHTPGVLAQPLYGSVMCASIIAIVFICRTCLRVSAIPGVKLEKLKQS